MPTIDIRIKDKIAMRTGGEAFIVRDNSDYVINFTFDVEWAEETAKTARFALQRGGYMDVPFTGSSVAVPVISTGRRVDVGVFAGNLRTTTSATLPLVPSIRSKGGAPVPPEDAVYDKLIALINSMGEISDDDIKQAVEDYLSANPIAAASMRVDSGYIQYSNDNGNTWVNLIAEADLKGDKGDKGADGVNGVDGKDGAPGIYYGTTQPAGDTHPVWIDPDGGPDDGGLLPAVTADDNGKVLRVVSGAWSAQEMPSALPNPHALTFTGAVTGSYDGSAPMSVEIPSGGGSGSDISLGLTGASAGQIAKITAVDDTGKPTAWEAVDMPSGGGGDDGAKEFRLIQSITLGEQSDRVDISVDSSGSAFALHEVYVMLSAQSYEDAYHEVNFLPNGRWGTGDAFITSANKASKSSETWKNNMVFHSVYADGVICSEQLPAKGENRNLSSSFAINQAIITKISIACKFAAGCTFLVIGR